MNGESLRIADVPKQLQGQFLATLNAFSVGIWNSHTDNRFVPCGTGTFVCHNGTYGIITARHVVDQMEKESGQIAFVGGDSTPIYIDSIALTYSTSEKAQVESEGPDIGFIRIPESHISFFKARRTYLDLDIQLDKKTFDSNFGFYLVCGFPDEQTSSIENNSIANYTMKLMHGLCGAPTNLREEPEHDYYELEIIYTDTNSASLPRSFGGCSGGSVWHVIFSKSDDGYEMVDYLFTGVVFYQTKMTGKIRNLVCHGRKSIYEYLLPKIGA